MSSLISVITELESDLQVALESISVYTGVCLQRELCEDLKFHIQRVNAKAYKCYGGWGEFTHSLTHSLTRSLSHSLAREQQHSHTHSPTHTFTYSLTLCFVNPLTCAFGLHGLRERFKFVKQEKRIDLKFRPPHANGIVTTCRFTHDLAV